ncbi:involucrin-like [Pecten maximus]|uniref:involucrin-like n=1 Tax=Pecten maximus TaxID=6579 RepID=UPI001458ECE4|nr:involucrin-like [Pecten maximus]
MNQDDKSKIIQNLTYLKERLLDLDPIIDQLIENGVFRFDHRAQIEQISKPTPHRQFNEFIKLLTSSANREAYNTFIDALKNAGYIPIAQKLQKTTPKEVKHSSFVVVLVRSSSRLANRISSASTSVGRKSAPVHEPVVPVQVAAPEDAGASSVSGARSDGCTDCSNTVKAVLEAFGKNQEQVLENIERQRREDIQQLEKQRQKDKQEYQQQVLHLFGKWQAEKHDIVKHTEASLEKLQEEIDVMRKVNVEYSFLKEQYDYLREKQQGMREKDNERRERLLQLTKEKEEAKRENQKLETKIEHLETKLQMSEDTREDLENKQYECTRNIERLESEKDDLLAQLREKEQENKSLRERVEEQYVQITDLLQKQREHDDRHEDPEFSQTVEQQMRKLDMIYGMMQTISKEKTTVPQGKLECRPKKMVLGPATSKASFADRRKMRTDRFDS